MQERLNQSEFMNSLCSSSINTIRMTTYRSPIDNQSHVLSIILRIGKEGSLVDNAHAGGLFCSVNFNGLLGKKLYDQYGNSYTQINDKDFSSEDRIIPDMDKIIEFANDVADRIPHLRLLALDVMINDNNDPVLVEYNCQGYSSWLFQMTGFPAFGDYTQEIIDYCSNKKNEATRVYVGL